MALQRLRLNTGWVGQYDNFSVGDGLGGPLLHIGRLQILEYLDCGLVEYTSLEEETSYQIGWFFGKVPKGGVVIFNPKIYVADFGNFKQGFLSMKSIQKSNFRVQGMFFSTIALRKNQNKTNFEKGSSSTTSLRAGSGYQNTWIFGEVPNDR